MVASETMPSREDLLARRDLTLDLARVACVLLVVVIHLLMVGVGVAPDGTMVASMPLEEQPWFPAATWAGQIMPLFFVVGGFAAATGWRSAQRKGQDAGDYVRSRALRLSQPALPLFVFFAIVLGAVALLGVAPDLVAFAARGAGTPLWFLAAYLLCQAVVPVMSRLHESAPVRTVLGLSGAVVLVDVVRFAFEVPAVGWLNLFFVWVLIQQIGFWYADGWFDRRSPWTLIAIAALGYLALVPLTAWGPYPVDMLANLNPPTLCLVVLGVAQAALLRLLKPVLSAVMRVRVMQGIVLVAGSRLMTIYLWHLPVLLAVAGLTLLIPGAAPEPASAAWWWSRPLVLLAALGLLYLLTLAIARWEGIGELAPRPPVWVIAVAVVCAFLPPFAVTVWALDVWIALWGSVLLAVAVVLLRRAGSGRRGEADARASAESSAS